MDSIIVSVMSHGSLQYWPHRRARNRLPRMRNVAVNLQPGINNIIAYKAGMTHLSMIDDSNSPSKNQEISKACTILEIPKIEAYGIRFYTKQENTNYTTTKTELYYKPMAQSLKIKKLQNDESHLDSFKQKLKEFSDIRIMLVAYPKGLAAEQHHPVRFESQVGGKNLEEKFDFVSKALGKEVNAKDFFKAGEHVDVISISKGKGWQGVVKRFHVKRNARKATGKRRHGGPIGAYSPGKVFYSVPRAGQLGFNYRTEHNKRILKLGSKSETEAINKKEGFQNYGVVRNDYIVIAGSVPGPAKRLVRVRKSIRERDAAGLKEPKIVSITR